MISLNCEKSEIYNYADRRYSMVFWGVWGEMDLLEWIIKIQQIPPSGCSRSVDSSDLLTLSLYLN